MSASLSLVLPHIVHYIHNDHEEPHKHGHQHGYISGLPLQTAEIHPRVQQFNQRLACVLAQRPRVLPPAALAHPPHRALTYYPIHCLRLQVQSLHQLLECAVTVPGIVVKTCLCTSGTKLLLAGVPQLVM